MPDNQPVIVERTFNLHFSTLWEAITDAGAMRKWFIPVTEFRPEVGFEFQFLEGDNKEKYQHICKVTEVVDGKKISYTWRYDGYEGNTLVTFELFPDGSKTILRLTHAGTETFPANKPELSKQNHADGWEYLIGKSLKNYLGA